MYIEILTTIGYLSPIAAAWACYKIVYKPFQDAKNKKRNQSKNDAILGECPTWTAHNISKLLN
jgi:hypothetical protein